MVRSDLLLIRLLSDALRRNIREISPETPSEHLGIVKNEILFKHGPTVTSLNINFTIARVRNLAKMISPDVINFIENEISIRCGTNGPERETVPKNLSVLTVPEE